jgi:hypothetical protein
MEGIGNGMRYAILLLLLFPLIGCVPPKPPSVELVPSVLDCGDVRMIENPLYLSFAVKNTGNKLVRIEEIASSCGCTIADLQVKFIKPGQQISVPVTVSILGQTGAFRHQLFVRLAKLPEPIPIEIKGNVLDDLRYTPPVVRMTIESQTGSSQGYFEIYTDKHHDLQFDFTSLPDHFKIYEVSRRRLAEETIIRLSLEIEARQDLESRSYKLTLQPTDQTIAPLTVSALCLAAE